MIHENPEKINRLEKLSKLIAAGYHPYPAKFKKDCLVQEVLNFADDTHVSVAGRLMTQRDMGKICFAHIQDQSGKVQVVLQQDVIGKEIYDHFVSLLDLGDHIGVTGKMFVTKKGEKSILLDSFTFLGKALLPLPEKFHGLANTETSYRQRYLDVISNPETRERFLFRSKFIKTLRDFYAENGFIEVETPTLLHTATGAAAKPYITHNNALDIDVALRISHELPLKEIVVAGFDKVFEIGKAFRNEGQDPSHLPEHTHVEHYAAYWDYQDNIAFTEKMFAYLFEKLSLPTVLPIKDKEGVEREVNWATPWAKINFIDLVTKDSGLDILSYKDADTLRKDLKKQNIAFEGIETMGLSTLIDNVYKKVSRPKLINPTILFNYPKTLQPLARVNDDNPDIVDQFQLVVNGWEVVKAYSELVDPLDQRERFVEQLEAKESGDEEAMDVDEDYLTAMEHGMPPISGWGMGVDRILALLTNQENLRDVVFFPLMRPIHKEEPTNE